MLCCTTEAIALHLEEIAQVVAPGAHAVLLLDQAGWHITKKLVVPADITLLPLPARAPELNPWDCPVSSALAGAESAGSALILGLNGEAWERVLIGSLIVAVIAVGFVALSTAGSLMTRKRDTEAAERSLDRHRETVAEIVAAARAEGVAAGQAAVSAFGRAERERLSTENRRLQKLFDQERAACLALEKTNPVLSRVRKAHGTS